MRLPKIAIIGRPNVGKSLLFNRICKRRISIVDEMEGVTRDRIYAKAEFFGHPFELIDTAGIDFHSKVSFNESLKRQTLIAIEEADSLILVVDGRVGPTLLDEEVAKLLHTTNKPVTLAINKIDDPSQVHYIHKFHGLGVSNLVPVSAMQGYQIVELIEAALKDVQLPEGEVLEDETIRVAIVGRPNVGKSTLMNLLLQEERCLVSPIAGTTRDSIDVKIEVEGTKFTIIDTAGIRRKKSEKEAVEKFAAVRTTQAIERAHICIMMLDAREGMTAQEKRIANEIEEQGKGCILLFNKWDLVKGFRMEHCLKAIHQEVPFLNYCPSLFVSAKTGRNLENLYHLIKQVYEEGGKRVTTGQLNRFIEKTLQKCHPPMLQGRRLRIYYAAQVNTYPPAIVFFVNRPELMVDSYKKYVINQLRETYGFTGMPLVFLLKGKDSSKEPPSSTSSEEETVEEEVCEVL